MPDLRIWRVKDGRNEGWKDGWIERWLEGRARHAGARGRPGLALSGDLIRGDLGGRLESFGPLGVVFGAPGVL